ncbi:MAG: sigma-70 family RNA polymerase sigma factor [Actinomycetota bacterium]
MSPEAVEVADFEAFHRREWPAMVALAAAVTGDHLAAEDIAHEALIKAHRRWDTVGGYDKPGAWLRRITINLALSSRRRAKRELAARLRLADVTRTLAPAPVVHDDVWAAVRRLPGKQRAAIALFYLEDRTVAEIADALECAEATARVHLHRGRTALAQFLEGSR